jgi:hypothetical protein
LSLETPPASSVRQCPQPEHSTADHFNEAWRKLAGAQQTGQACSPSATTPL